MTEQTYPTMGRRASQDGVRISTRYLGERTDDQDVDRPWRHDAWSVKLTRKGRTLTTPYKMGTGHMGNAPDVETVLDSLCSDASSVVNADSFEDWAADFGYDADSRRAEKLYQECVKQTDKLRAFLGDDFDAYVFETERL